MDIINLDNSDGSIPFATDTSAWSLVIHKVSSTSANLWFGTLFPTLRKPNHCRIILSQGNEDVAAFDIQRADWQRPITKLSQRFYTTHRFEALSPNQHYQVKLYQELEGDEELVNKWLLVKSGEFNTLPNSLPSSAEQAFTVSLSSCFYPDKDHGRTTQAYEALYQQNNQQLKPDIKFMVGDQVYLDIGLDSLSPLTNEIRQRIADDYAQNWKALAGMLSKGGTWMLPDDHEYWNDYPFYDSLLPTLFMLKIAKVRNAWRQASRDGVNNIQCTSKVDIFNLGSDLSFCVADLRSHRSKTQFIDKKGFAQIESWAKGLTCPGVFVIPQILIVGENKHERNLLSFKAQYGKLLDALGHSGHDIVVLSGDVHFGRISQVELGQSGAKLVEIVASPMSNLTGANSIASAKAVSKPEHFPEPTAKIKSKLTSQAVAHDKNYHVSTERGRLFSSYWKERTKEHFMTIAFHKEAGEVVINVRAWCIRDKYSDGLPKQDFKEPFTIKLK